MSYKPRIVFDGEVGNPSTDNAGPEVLQNDLKTLARMFDPNSTHDDGSKGGISFENLNFNFSEDTMSEKIGSADIDELTASPNVYSQLVAIVEILTSRSNLSPVDTLASIGGLLNGEASNGQAIINSLYELVIDRYTKEQSDANLKAKTDELIKELSYDDESGVLTSIYADGTSMNIFDLNVEKIPASIGLVEEEGTTYIRITNSDGTYTQSDVTGFFVPYEFVATDTVAMTTEAGTGKITVKANVKDGSISRAKLDSEMLSALTDAERNAALSAESASASAESSANYAGASADSANEAKGYAESSQAYAQSSEEYANQSRTSATSAEASKNSALTHANTANTYANTSKSWAVGGTGTRSGENTNNAKYYAEQALASKTSAEAIATNTASTIIASVDAKVTEAEAEINTAVGTARAELQGYVASAESSAETAEYWAKQAEESAGGDFVTKTEFNTSLGTKADLIDGKVDPNQLPEIGGTALVVRFSVTETAEGEYEYECNTPFNDIKQAIIDGRLVYAVYDGWAEYTYALKDYSFSNSDDSDYVSFETVGYASDGNMGGVSFEKYYVYPSGYVRYIYDVVNSPYVTDTVTSSGTFSEYVPTSEAVYNAIEAVTPAKLGLGNVDNTSDMNKPVSTATQNAINSAVASIDVTEQLKETVRFDNEVTTVIGDDLKGESYTVEFTEDVVDNAPTENSPNLVTSGGVYKAIADIDVGEQLKETVRFDNEVSTVLADVLKSNEYVLEFSEEENESEYPPFVEDFSAVKNVAFGDGTITETYAGGISKVTTFNEDGSITEELTTPDGTTRKKTTFNEDGTISEVIL